MVTITVMEDMVIRMALAATVMVITVMVMATVTEKQQPDMGTATRMVLGAPVLMITARTGRGKTTPICSRPRIS